MLRFRTCLLLGLPEASHGFTLVEVLIALILTGTTALAAGSLINVSLQAVRDAREQTSLVVLARGRLEVFRAGVGRPPGSPPTTLDVDTPGYVELVDGNGAVSGTSSGAVFTTRWRVQQVTFPSTMSDGQVVRSRALGVRLAHGARSTRSPGDTSLALVLHR